MDSSTELFQPEIFERTQTWHSCKIYAFLELSLYKHEHSEWCLSPLFPTPAFCFEPGAASVAEIPEEPRCPRVHGPPRYVPTRGRDQQDVWRSSNIWPLAKTVSEWINEREREIQRWRKSVCLFKIEKKTVETGSNTSVTVQNVLGYWEPLSNYMARF